MLLVLSARVLIKDRNLNAATAPWVLWEGAGQLTAIVVHSSQSLTFTTNNYINDIIMEQFLMMSVAPFGLGAGKNINELLLDETAMSSARSQ